MKTKSRILLLLSIVFFSTTLSAQQSFNALDKLARSYFEKGNLDTAIIYGEKALVQAEKEFGKNDTNYCNALSVLTEINYAKGDYKQSMSYCIIDNDLRKNLQGEKHLDYILSLSRLGTLYTSMGKYAMAEPVFIKVTNDTKEVLGENNLKYTSAIGNLAALYYKMGNYSAAEPLFIKSMKITKKIASEKDDEYVRSITNLSVLYTFSGNYSAAEPLLLEGLKLRKEISGENSAAYSKTLNNLGKFYEFLGNFAAAEPIYIEALRIRKEVLGEKHPEYIISLDNLASLHNSMGNYSLVEPLLLKVLEISKEVLGEKHPNYGTALNNIANLKATLGDYQGSEVLYLESIKIRKEALGEQHRDYANSINNLGALYFQMGKYNQSEKLLLESLEIRKTVLGDQHMDYLSNVGNLVKLYRSTNKFSLTEQLYLQLISSLDKSIMSNSNYLSEREKELYFKRQRKYYDSFYSFAKLRKVDNPSITQEVYNNVIKNKGLLLKSSTAMRYGIINSNDTILIRKYNQWLNLNKEITKLYSTEIALRKKNPDALEKEANVLEKELVKGSQAFNNLEKLQGLNWQDVKNSLKPKEAAIEFIHFNEGVKSDSIAYCAIVITSKSKYPEMIPLFEEKQLTSLLGSYQGNNYEYINAVYGKNDSLNTKLYDLIWKPLEQSLKGIKTVHASPSGLLHKVSFAAISKKKGVYLCDNYKVNILSSTAKVVIPEAFILDHTAIAGIYGGVDFNTDSSKTQIWSYLEGTKTETEKINSTLTSNKFIVNYYSGKTASEKEFKKNAGKFTIIHMATHGFFYADPEQELELQKGDLHKKESKTDGLTFRGSDGGFGLWTFVKSKNPLMRSGLVLAGANDVWNVKYKSGNEEDGVLAAQEVATLDLQKTGLVVLSACETGLGDIKESEGVYGLQRAFKMAGAKYIIMSLWQVPDKETSEFMTSFYNKLTKEKNIKSAFTATQLEMRKKYDPYFWAAFVLIE